MFKRNALLIVAFLMISPMGGADDSPAVIDAVIRGDLQTVRRLVEKDPKVLEERSPQGVTALHMAASMGDVRIAQYLLEKGANIEDQVKGLTPVSYAAMGGHASMIRFLHQKGASMAVVNLLQETLLHYAAGGGYPDAVRYLLEAGVDKNLQNQEGYTAKALAEKFMPDAYGEKKRKEYQEVVDLLSKP